MKEESQLLTPSQVFKTGTGRYDLPEIRNNIVNLSLNDQFEWYIDKLLLKVFENLGDHEIGNFVMYQYQFAQQNQAHDALLFYITSGIKNSPVVETLTMTLKSSSLNMTQKSNMNENLSKLTILSDVCIRIFEKEKEKNKSTGLQRILSRFGQFFSRN